jgi:hypothetical protein
MKFVTAASTPHSTGLGRPRRCIATPITTPKPALTSVVVARYEDT